MQSVRERFLHVVGNSLFAHARRAMEKTPLALCAILLFGAFLRFYQLEYKSLWIDEIGQVVAAQGGFMEAIRGAVQHVAAPPLDYLVTWAMLQFGRNGIVTSEFVLRFPAVMWGILTIAMSYALARRMTRSKFVALITAYLVALAPLLIRFSQEMRFYALSILLSLALVYFFVRAWEKGDTRAWITFAVILLLAFFTHYYVIFVLGALLVYAFGAAAIEMWRAHKIVIAPPLRARLVGMGAAIAGCALIAVPWLMYARPAQAQQQTFALASLAELIGEPVMSGHIGGAWHLNAVRVLGLFIFPALAILGGVYGARQKNRWGILLALLVVLGAGGVVVLDYWFKYFFTSRQLLFLVPFYFILVASGIAALYFFLARRQKFVGAVFLFAALGSITIVFLFSARAYFDWPKDDWRSAARLLNSASAQTILVEPSTLGVYLTYYQPALQNAFTPKNSARVWIVTLGQSKPRALQENGWNAVRLDTSPTVNIFYAGAASEKELLLEAAAFDLPPHVLVYSDFLTRLNAVDAARAQSFTERVRAELTHAQPPLLDAQYARLLRRLRRLEP